MPRRIIKLPQFYITHLKRQPFYVILNTLAAISFFILFIWLYSQNTQLHKQDKANIHLTQENLHLLKKIQNNRRDLIWKSCREQNQRHKNSIEALNTLLKKSGVSKPRRTKAFKQTKILIDALVPFRNCVKLANTSVKPQTSTIKGEK